jgi:hypothetical protein
MEVASDALAYLLVDLVPEKSHHEIQLCTLVIRRLGAELLSV